MMNRRRFVTAAAGAAIFSRATNVFAAQGGYDLIIKGGRVIDPSVRLDAVRDVAISGGRIAAVETNITASAAQTIDARGKIVTAGLIDIHTHCGREGRGPGMVLQDGVTGWIDAGSQGADHIADSVAVAKTAPQQGRCLVNIGRAGILTEGDTMDINRADVGALRGCVRADRRRMGQILINLLTNAVKYNRAGGWVRLDSRRRERDGGGEWALIVRDSGRGMTREQLQRVFEPFNRLGAEHEGIEGTGIGLTIVRQLAERMGGGVEVDSEPGVGSEFRVWLPAAPEEPAQPRAAEPVDAPAAREGGAAPLSLLCVEDNLVNMTLVREVVSLRPSVTLSCADTGAQGIAAALRQPPDVVLLDLQLPDMHGLEVMRRLRSEARCADATIIALSANAMPDDVRAALDAGFDAYWTKPIDFNRFLAGLDELAQRKAEKAKA